MESKFLINATKHFTAFFLLKSAPAVAALQSGKRLYFCHDWSKLQIFPQDGARFESAPFNNEKLPSNEILRLWRIHWNIGTTRYNISIFPGAFLSRWFSVIYFKKIFFFRVTISCKGENDVNLTYTGLIEDLEVPDSEQLGLSIPLRFLKKMASVDSKGKFGMTVDYKIFI